MISNTIAGRYQVIEKIGQGGAAEVFKATDSRLGRIVAIKLLRDSYSDDPTFTQRFENEARAAARLSHPNIVDVYDYDESNGRYFIAMEFVPGHNLKDYINEHAPLSEDETRTLITQVLSGLSAAHKAGLIHRDMKSHNILVTPEGQAKIADFGIAKAMGDAGMTEAGIAFGTPHYLAPEQARGDEVTPRTDIYAVGVIMYEMLSGRLPFEGDNPMKVAYAHVFDTPTPLREVNPNVSEGMEAIVSKAMAREPEQRFRSADDMLRALESFRPGGLINQEATVAVPVVGDFGTPPTSGAGEPPITGRLHQYGEGDDSGRSRKKWLWLLLPLLLLLIAIGALLARNLNGNNLGIVTQNSPTATQAIQIPTTPPTDTPVPDTPVPTQKPTSQPTNTPSPTKTPSPTPTPVPPKILTSLKAKAQSTNSVNLEWTDENNKAPKREYVIERLDKDGQWKVLSKNPADNRTYTDNGLQPGHSYLYRVKVTNDGQNSPYRYANAQTLTPTDTPTNTPTPLPPTETPTPTDTPTPVPPTPTDTPTASPTTQPTPQANLIDNTKFDGGYQDDSGVYKGRTVTWLLSSDPKYSSATAKFDISEPIQGNANGQIALVVTGMDSSDAGKANIRIEINGKKVYEGPDPLQNDPANRAQSNWKSTAFLFPADYIKQGKNEITITNLDKTGKHGKEKNSPDRTRSVILDFVAIAYYPG